MTLAEAIAHEEWAATTAHGELADEHAQMRDWLRELERLRSARDVWQENDAKLRKLVRDMRQEHECCHLTWPAAIIDRARELGIEVDE